MDTQAPEDLTGPAVPVAFAGRTSTLTMQDPVASMRRQARECRSKLLPGMYIAAWYWDIESGGMDLEDRGHGTEHELFTGIGIPRDGGLADLLSEAASPAPRFAAVICEDIERSGRDTFNALKLERELSGAGVPLFATDEPIDIAGVNSTTVLVCRVKQGVAEWFRLQIKEKAWKGLREHSLDGWNTGTPPYGYLAERVRHPVPIKAAQGRTKSRLVPDPVRAAAVAQIFTWRAQGRLGVTTITARLNADHAQFPPPKGGLWTEIGVYTILANPKYTRHMVWNRKKNISSKGRRTQRANPPDQWIWTPTPVHPPIITRALYDAAQQVTAARAAASGEPGQPAHPLARRSYEFRSLLRHRACKRRMCGTTRPAGIYYMCPHDVNDPRHLAACPDHPRTVTLREDHLAAVIAQFIDERLTGPDRAALLTADAAGDTARRRKRAASLEKQIRRIETSQKNVIGNLEHIDPAAPAAAAMRDRAHERIAELEADRATARAELDTLNTTQARTPDPGLLQALPQLPARLADLPLATRSKLYQALGIEMLYKHDTCQVTCRATITTSTPHTIAAIIHDSTPQPPTTDTASSDPALPPIGV